MAKAPQLSALRVDDLKDVPEEMAAVLEQVFFALNPFLTTVRDGLSGKLGWENFKALVRTIPIAKGQTYPINLSVADLVGSPQGVIVLQCINTGTKTPALAPRVAWGKATNGNKAIQITALSDLSATDAYELTLLITGA